MVVPAYVYILRCADGSYYVGSTHDELEKRIGEHDAGMGGAYTSRRRPVKLIFAQRFTQITDAVAAERQLKGWSRAKKEALMAGNFDMLRMLARNRTEHPRPSTGSG